LTAHLAHFLNSVFRKLFIFRHLHPAARRPAVSG
jgi:hypothetical protein